MHYFCKCIEQLVNTNRIACWTWLKNRLQSTIHHLHGAARLLLSFSAVQIYEQILKRFQGLCVVYLLPSQFPQCGVITCFAMICDMVHLGSFPYWERLHLHLPMYFYCIRQIPICQGVSHFPGFLFHFVMAKLSTTNMRVKSI